MIEIIIMGSMLAILLHASRQVVQHMNVAFQLGTLAAKDAQQAVTLIDASRTQGLRITKLVGQWFIDALTAGQGPILVGMSTGLDTAAKVEEALEADPQDLEDVPAMEQANRKVAPQAVLTQDSDGAVGGGDGHWPIQRKQYMPFKMIEEGNGLELFAYNLGSAALASTDPLVRFVGVCVGEWLRD